MFRVICRLSEMGRDFRLFAFLSDRQSLKLDKNIDRIILIK